MRLVFIFIIFTIFSVRSLCQVVYGDSLKILFLPMDELISDSSHLHCSIMYENISKRPVFVYKRLSNGYMNDRFCNVNVVVEREDGGKYVDQQTMFYNRNPKLLYADSLRHYDLPKISLVPLAKDTLILDFYKLGLGFEKGNYRIKINLRIRTIQDITEYHDDPTGATAPPDDKIQYTSSGWIYFKVLKRIYITR
jgi:hypothetical protein